ncbi:hypothetical protein O6H91_10G063700 [Diphasiastrum complanatum]|uniref:Uncharacterized protein n=3 Tax=Diphasiastrum complanatum TaxID=34168 RepID=A0ACC2CHM9_DIPCM|nr:hypothetical protein O6H91_10G063700 [Diphasiastrum complanatum]KAJ7541515.1 hypothetical protein O6H91_10G063700 [Diphasiastrum complanatum]KAJ7541516.1 hypothetical protein O6H91_10G063700 [Diphasiastrum complanatum]
MGKKKFIDKKRAATFALVFKESFEGGDLGSERVFARVDNGSAQIAGFEESDEDECCPKEQEEELHDDSIFADAEEDSDGSGHKLEPQPLSTKIRQGLPERLRQELLELGFADDGYNYMQHLRTVGKSGGSSQFVPTTRRQFDPVRPDVKAYDASKVQIKEVTEGEDSNNTPIQVSSKTHQIQRPPLKNEGFDPEIAAALEDNDGSECASSDVLEDDFVIMANKTGDDNLPSLSNTSFPIQEKLMIVNLEHKRLCEENLRTHMEDTTDGSKSRPSRLLDEQFEMLALREYEEDEFIEPEEPDPLAKGHAEISQFSSVLSEFLNSTPISAEKYDTPARTGELHGFKRMTHGYQEVSEHAPCGTNASMDSKLKEWYHVHQSIPENLALEEEELVLVEDGGRDGEGQWDCQSVVSNYSNLENHPAKISTPGRRSCKPPTFGMALKSFESTTKHIQLGGRQKLPLEFIHSKGKFPKTDGKSKGNTPSSGLMEPQIADPDGSKVGLRGGETPEERKARKAAVKEERREARKMKKDLRLRYKGESQKAQLSAAVMGPPSIHLP